MQIKLSNAVYLNRSGINQHLIHFLKEFLNFANSEFFIRHKSVGFTTSISLRPYQKLAIEAASGKDSGVISAPPGSGKTVIGLKIIAEKQQPALIIIHRKQLLEQWIERIQAFLGIPKHEIGSIGQGKAKPGKIITDAMFQSLGKYLEKQEADELKWSFGTLIVDECHHIPAKTFRNTISKLSPYYQYGLTATPFRKGNDRYEKNEY